MQPLRRHDLAYLCDGASIQLDEDAPLPRSLRAWLFNWIAAGKPLVVARQHAKPEGLRAAVRLGAAAPLHLGRARITCSVLCSDVSRAVPPLTPAAVLDCLPGTIAGPLARLSELAQDLGVAVGVYGSTAWECLSGERYRRPGSDLDLICDANGRGTLEQWLRAMQWTADKTNGRLDGEIRFPGGHAVAWQELAGKGLGNADAKVLVKNLRNVGFMRVGALIESLR